MARNQSHLRIIGGTLGGRKILAPPGLDTRPLPDRIKQSLFDWLGQDLSGLQVADICAGSGAFDTFAIAPDGWCNVVEMSQSYDRNLSKFVKAITAKAKKLR